MNPKNTSFHALEIFLAVAKEKNFSEVARRYDMASSVISRQIKQLEDDFGQTLFYRNTRSMMLTQAGERFCGYAQTILHQFDRLHHDMYQTDSEPTGIVRINAPVFFGQKHLTLHLPELQTRYPKLNIHLTQTDDFIDPYSQTADLIVRVASLADSNLKMKIIARQRHFLLASPNFLDKFGTPKSMDDLPHYQGLFYRGQLGVLHWRFGKAGQIIDGQPYFVSNNATSLIEMAVNGLGIVMMPDWAVADEIRSGKLIPILADTPISSDLQDIYIALLTPQSTYRPHNVQTVMDFLVEKWNQGEDWRV
ncbi:LysR substrate-binding domain-containing protein [Neisseria sp. CCUG17229]|uniref:LysR family transcriptional regulator n=1 Tax=Neisseria sp. CCUG17229 TaxID=3392036 RepID=UPI003A0FFFEA